MRPVLLRVLTDLYVSRAHHGADEMNQFEAVALGLLDKADAETRAIVANKLANCGATPRGLAERIVADGGPSGAAMLARSIVLPRAWLLCAAMGEAADLAAAVASRPDLDAQLCEILALRPEIEVARALAGNAAAPLDSSSFRALAARLRGEPEFAARLCARAPRPFDMTALFLHATQTQRAAILLAARRAELGAPSRRPATQVETATAAELERAAKQRDWPLFTAIMARALDCAFGAARALLEDTRGEAVALALRALHVEDEAAARIFMCLDPVVAHSVERVRALTKLYGEISQPGALRLISAMVDQEAPAPRRPTHAPTSDAGAAPTSSRPSDNARMAEQPREAGRLLFVKRRS